MDTLNELKELMLDEIQSILDKDYFTSNDLDLAFKMVDVIKDVGKIESMGICNMKHRKQETEDNEDLLMKLGAMMSSATIGQNEKDTIQKVLTVLS